MAYPESPQDYSSLFQFSQPVPAGSWMPQAKPIAFPYASSSYAPADYSLGNANIPQPGLQLGSASIATPGLTNAGGSSIPSVNAPGSIWDSFLQQRNADGTTSGGYGQAGLGMLQGLGGLYLGMQQYNLAKEALANSKEQFNRNFAVQKGLTNSQLEDRQRARVASNPGAYQSVGDYMAQNGVK